MFLAGAGALSGAVRSHRGLREIVGGAVLAGTLLLTPMLVFASGTADPQPELAQFNVGGAGSSSSGTTMPDGTIVLGTITSGGQDVYVCVIPLGHRGCTHYIYFHKLKGEAPYDFNAIQTFATHGNDAVVVVSDSSRRTQPIGEFSLTDDGRTASTNAARPVGNLSSYTYATDAHGDIVVASGSAPSMQVQELPNTNGDFATLGTAIDEHTSITTYQGGVLVAYDDGTNTYVYYAKADSEFNSSSSYQPVATFDGETVSAVSDGALLTNVGGLTGGERLRFFNGGAFGPAHHVPEPAHGDDGGFTMQQSDHQSHIFFINRRNDYDLYAEATGNGTSFGPFSILGPAAAANSFVPLLGMTGTGIVYEGDGSPLLAQPILKGQKVTITLTHLRISPGTHTTLDGSVSPSIRDDRISIERGSSGSWQHFATTQESSAGAFAVKLAKTGRYRAVAENSPGRYRFGYSNSVTVSADQ
jgi:hypothetical protein